jgi:flavodoxin
MKRTLVIYQSKYGSTEEIAASMARILGPSKMIRPWELGEEHRGFDNVVIGLPIYRGLPPAEISELIESNVEWLRERKVALFCTCLIGEKGLRYLDPVHDLLGESVVWRRSFNGRMIMDDLDDEDGEAIMRFSEMNGHQAEDKDLLDMAYVNESTIGLLHVLRGHEGQLPEEEVRRHIETFLERHNSCVLSTGHGDEVRGTPLEYWYHDGHIYLVSEGGRKFAYLALNQNVSVTVFNNYKGLETIAGLQIEGLARLVDPGIEYDGIMEKIGFDPGRISSLPFNMNLIEIRIGRAEFLWHKFRKMGGSITQRLDF